MQGIEHEARPSGSAMDSKQGPAAEQPVWKRSHVVWFLIALSLVPGAVAAAFRSEWIGLPAGVRMSAYVVSGVLIVAACALMLREDPGAPAARQDSAPSGDSP